MKAIRIIVYHTRHNDYKCFTIHKNIELVNLKKLIHKMITELREDCINLEGRFTFEEESVVLRVPKRKRGYVPTTHRLQIHKVVNNKVVETQSFGFVENVLNCAEICDSLKLWLEGKYKKEGLIFPECQEKVFLEELK